MPNLPRSELQSADPSFSYICAGTDGPCTTIDWRHRVEPINPTPNNGWKSSGWISNSSILTWSSQICQAPTDGLLWLCWSWLARSSSPSQPETWESDAFTVVLHSYISFLGSCHEPCRISVKSMILRWFTLDSLIHYDLASWQSDISGMTHPRWWTWGKSWEWSAPLGPPWSRAPTTEAAILEDILCHLHPSQFDCTSWCPGTFCQELFMSRLVEAFDFIDFMTLQFSSSFHMQDLCRRLFGIFTASASWHLVSWS